VKIRIYLMFLVVLIGLSACGPASTPPPTLTPLPSSTHTTIPTNTPLPTHTPPPPTETPIPTPTIPPDIWLDSQEFELTLHHPLDPNQSNWESIYEIVIPVDGYVAGVIFTVDESDITWGPAASLSVPGKGSLLKLGSMRSYSSGSYCVSDYFLSYNPDSTCQILAPDSIPLNWITPYFAGKKTQVGVAFQIGGCDPAKCTVDLVISKIQLIMYNPE
jgi:hypothetical protein